jgi:hypothetical protein
MDGRRLGKREGQGWDIVGPPDRPRHAKWRTQLRGVAAKERRVVNMVALVGALTETLGRRDSESIPNAPALVSSILPSHLQLNSRHQFSQTPNPHQQPLSCMSRDSLH